jgi:Helix-turn-helix domain
VSSCTTWQVPTVVATAVPRQAVEPAQGARTGWGYRLVMILLSQHDRPATGIAELLGCDPRTVRRWVHRYDQEGAGRSSSTAATRTYSLPAVGGACSTSPSRIDATAARSLAPSISAW